MLPVLSIFVCLCLLPPPSPFVFDAVCESEKELESWLQTKTFDVNGLSPNPNPNRPSDRQGTTLLVLAARRSKSEAVALLLRHGAKVDVRGSSGDLPLHATLDQARIDLPTVEMLLKACADPYATNARNQTAFQLFDEDPSTLLDLVHSYDVHYLAEQGQFDRMREMIKVCPHRLTMRNADGDTLLHTAAGAGRREVVDWLIENGADLKATNRFGESVVCSAAIWNQKEIANHLLSKGVPLDTYSAIALGKRKRVEDELDRSPAWAKSVDGRGFTPLHWAVRHHDLSIVQLLISRGADLNAIDADGYTPLRYAIQFDYLDVLNELIKAGCDLRVLDKSGTSAMDSAVLAGKKDLVVILHKAGASLGAASKESLGTPLIMAVIGGHPEIARYLVDQGAPLDDQASNGRAAIHCAVQEGNLELATLLAERGANLNLRTQLDETPLCIAVQEHNIDMLNVLLKFKADPNVPCHFEFTPFMSARTKGYEDFATLLAEAGAESSFSMAHRASFLDDKSSLRQIIDQQPELLNQQDPTGATPLFYATVAKKEDCVEFLLSRGADPNIASKKGQTPLSLSDSKGPIFKLLRKHGALQDGENMIQWAATFGKLDLLVTAVKEHPELINEKKSSGNTPLHLAAYNGNFGCLAHLLAHGADPQIRNAKNQTPLEFVPKRSDGDYPKIIRALKQAEKRR